MKLVFTVSILITCSALSNAQSHGKEFRSKQFNWTILIPEDFTSVSREDQDKLKEKGQAVVEDTFGEKVEFKNKSLFVFRKGPFNYFEANYVPFEETGIGDYASYFKQAGKLIYETFMIQMQGAKIDTATSVEMIDKLQFHKISILIAHPNGMKLHMYMYGRLFDMKDFTVNILYMEESEGVKIMEAWRGSKFGK